MLVRISFPILVLATASPALAAGHGITWPQPADFAMLGVGVIGLLIGRYVSRSRREQD